MSQERNSDIKKNLNIFRFADYVKSFKQQHKSILNLNDTYAVYLHFNDKNLEESKNKGKIFIEKLTQLTNNNYELLIREPVPYRVKSKPSKESLSKIGKGNGITDIEFVTTYVSPQKTPTQIVVTMSEKDFWTMKDHDLNIMRNENIQSRINN